MIDGLAMTKPENWPLVSDELRKAQQRLSDAEWAGRKDSEAAASVRSLLRAQAWGELRVPPF
jgi:hypothetical protein